VTKFANVQEHALDASKVKHDTDFSLSGDVAQGAAAKLEARNAKEVSLWV